MTSLADKKMTETRQRILAESPKMAEAPHVAALGNLMIAENWLYLTPISKLRERMASMGIYDTEADTLIAQRATEELEYNG